MSEADPFTGGSFPIVMDHSLAKVLAHEAFGHAAEADSFRSSVLARDGKFRVGEEVASGGVHLIDESLPGDHAFQPYSSNGVPRTRAPGSARAASRNFGTSEAVCCPSASICTT